LAITGRKGGREGEREGLASIVPAGRSEEEREKCQCGVEAVERTGGRGSGERGIIILTETTDCYWPLVL
jgi:hypothetical protein